MKNRLISIILLICIMLSFTGCGRTESDSKKSVLEQKQQSENMSAESISVDTHSEKAVLTEEGWLMTEVDIPQKMQASAAIASDSDWIWIAGRGTQGGSLCLTVLGFDTVEQQWQQFSISLSAIGVGYEYDDGQVQASKLTVKDGYAWMWVECSTADRSAAVEKLVTVDTVSGAVNATDWTPETALSHPNEYVIAFAAISAEQALIITSAEACIIDRNFTSLANKDIEAYQVTGICEIGDQLYLTSYDGLTTFDIPTLSVGRFIPVQFEKGNSYFIAANSRQGNIICSNGTKLISVDSSPGQPTPIFDWMDVAISKAAMSPHYLFENSQSVIYCCVAGERGLELVKVEKTQVPVKDVLTMACFYDTSSTNAQTRMTGDMMDAVLRFNNSDAEYRIEPIYFEYAGSADLSRALMEAFNSPIDLVDQSNLPEGSISGSQLVDMLPYLDSDEELSRDDFFSTALKSMMWGGHLYRVSPYYSALGMNVSAGIYPGEDYWSCGWIQQAVEVDPSLSMGQSKRYTHEYIMKVMAHAITGEFIDIGNMRCDFQRAEFVDWLNMMISLMDDTGLAEDRISFTCGADSYYTMRSFYAKEGISYGSVEAVGFPNSSGNGFYLVSPAAVVAIQGEYNGMNTSVSIASGCKNSQAAWEFIKQLLKATSRGIPILKSAFDSAMDYNARAYGMPQNDIDALRSIVENASGTVIAEPELIQLILGELNAYVSGDKTAEVVADQLQSRVSIYLSERG